MNTPKRPTGTTQNARPGTTQKRQNPAASRATNEFTYGRRKRPNAALLSFLRLMMVVCICGTVLSGLLLLILPTFKVSSVDVTGNTIYTDAEIIAASGIYEGQELLAMDSAENIRKKIFKWDTKRYITTIGIHRRFGKVTIEITEPANLLYTEQNGQYYVLDGNLRMLHKTNDLSAVAQYPRIVLPGGASFSQGKSVTFPIGGKDTAYIADLIQELKTRIAWERVTELDVSQKFNVSYVVDDTCRIKLGKVGDLDTKLALVAEILSRRNADLQIVSVVDVSDTAKPTYRALSAGDVLNAG